MRTFEEINGLNRNMVLEVDKEEICIKAYRPYTRMPFRPKKEPGEIEVVLAPFRGKHRSVINSDVYQATDKKIMTKRLEPHLLKRMADAVLNDAIPFLSKVSAEEKMPILIQTHHEPSIPEMTITAGLIEDMQVVLFTIRYADAKKEEEEE